MSHENLTLILSIEKKMLKKIVYKNYIIKLQLKIGKNELKINYLKCYLIKD